MQKFFKDTIVSSFIKEFIYSQNIPSCSSAVDGDFVVNGVRYIYKKNIVKITKSGKIGEDAEYVTVRGYNFNDPIQNVTENFFSKFNYYDSETHYQLGRYLRLLRDCRGIDLMPFYNCFNYKIVNDIYLGEKDQILSIGDNISESGTEDYKIVLIPINFGKKYTICIDSYCGFRAKPVFYGQFGRILDLGIDRFKRFEDEMRVLSSSFKNPIIYNCNFLEVGKYVKDTPSGEAEGTLTDENMARLKSIEKYLYLLIQLPIGNKSSILVQEGDYTSLNKKVTLKDGSISLSKVYDEDHITDLSDRQLNSLLLSDLQLQRISTDESYPFSNRLVEYLLDNVITKDDQYGKDIERVKKALNTIGGGLNENGVWSNDIRGKMFSHYMLNMGGYSYHNNVDINGFVDMNTEDYIDRVTRDRIEVEE